MSSTDQIIFSFFLSFLCVQRVDLLVLYFLFLSFAHVRCGRLCYRLSDSHAAYIRRRQCGAAARQPVGAAARRTKEPIDTKRLIDFSKDRIHLSIFTSCATTIILCFFTGSIRLLFFPAAAFRHSTVFQKKYFVKVSLFSTRGNRSDRIFTRRWDWNDL